MWVLSSIPPFLLFFFVRGPSRTEPIHYSYATKLKPSPLTFLRTCSRSQKFSYFFFLPQAPRSLSSGVSRPTRKRVAQQTNVKPDAHTSNKDTVAFLSRFSFFILFFDIKTNSKHIKSQEAGTPKNMFFFVVQRKSCTKNSINKHSQTTE